jgi:hypothetical protein
MSSENFLKKDKTIGVHQAQINMLTSTVIIEVPQYLHGLELRHFFQALSKNHP